MKLLAVLVLAACGPAVDFPADAVSKCGMKLYNASDALEDTFQAAEDRFVHEFHGACHKLEGASVVLREADARGMWTDAWGRDVAGSFNCDAVSVAKAPWPKTWFAHEARHLLDCPATDYVHARWTEADWAAIERAR